MNSKKYNKITNKIENLLKQVDNSRVKSFMGDALYYAEQGEVQETNFRIKYALDCRGTAPGYMFSNDLKNCKFNTICCIF